MAVPLTARYSVDMLRLETKVNVPEFQHFMDTSKEALFVGKMEYFQSFRHSDYRHLWQIQEGNPFDFSYALMLQHNMERNTLTHHMVIEFNPNKCTYSGFFKQLLSNFFGFRFVVKSLDMACDVEVPIDSLIYTTSGKQYFSIIQSASGKTMYFGKRGVGQVKIYDKLAERRQAGDPAYLNPCHELTRIEKTIKIDRYISDSFSYDFAAEQWPELFVPALDEILPNLGVKDTLMLLGLRQRPDLIDGLSKNTKRKYAAMLQQQKIDLIPGEMGKAYRACMARMAKELYEIEAFNGG